MLVSVVTATYNRAATLPALFASIVAQDADVEWVVVDDGSTDGTAELVTAMAESAPFPVRLLRQPNRGKHVALNRGIPMARGSMALLIDSDDALLPGGLGRLLDRWGEIPAGLRGGFFGVVGRCFDETGRRIGDRFPGRRPVDCNWHDAVYVHRARGDRSGLLRTDVLRAHPFPEPDDRSFVMEGLVWRQIGRRYLTRYVDDPLVLVNTSGHDRLTRRPVGEICAALRDYHAVVLTQDMPWFRHSPALFVRAAVQYGRLGMVQRIPLHRQGAELSGRARLLWASMLPVSALLWLRDRRGLSGGRSGRPGS
jgi:glycosyltransferase involved in cell wall biosynthesis